MTGTAMQPDLDRLAAIQERTAPFRAAQARVWGDNQPGMTREQLTADTLGRCRTARDRGVISGAWSTGEQLLVALVLLDAGHLEAMDYTPQQAHERVYGDLPVAMAPREYLAWLNDLRLDL